MKFLSRLPSRRKMSSKVTLGNLKRITAPELADQLLTKAQDPSNSSIAIVDVRDDGKEIHLCR